MTGSDLQFNTPIIIIVMGVSGSGKSTLGRAIADWFGMPYIDGDDLHPQVNVEKMESGQPLNDADREPWLLAIRNAAEQAVVKREVSETEMENRRDDHHQLSRSNGVVISCSALKRRYRDVLRGCYDGSNRCEKRKEWIRTYFVFIDGPRQLLVERMSNRTGHFMKVAMLDSQLATLESPVGEKGVVVVSASDSTQEQANATLEALRESMYS